MTLPTDPKARKAVPLHSGLVAYFKDALIEVAKLSQVGNDQHNPGQPLHWDQSKSNDHEDCLLRHHFEAGTVDTDGVRHSTKRAWRSLAALQLELKAAVVDMRIPAGTSRIEIQMYSAGGDSKAVELGGFDEDDVAVEAGSVDEPASKNSEVYNGQEGWVHAYTDYEDSRK